MNFEHEQEILKQITRRTLFKQVGFGIGGVALTSLLSQASAFGLDLSSGQGVRGLHHKPRAKNIIHLFMTGAPSQIDLLDYKPYLNQHHGEVCPPELLQGQNFAFIEKKPKLYGSPHKFAQVGSSRRWVSELLPHFKEIVDDVTVVNSMSTHHFNHAPAQLFINTGNQMNGRPSFGSWSTYGLGTENQDLPGFVVLQSGPIAPDSGKASWGCGFLPSEYQGVELRTKGEPVLFVRNPNGVTQEIRRDTLDALRALNEIQLQGSMDPEIQARIAQYELAYRMQTSVPELMDITKEPKEMHELYGTEPGKKSFANNCLLARRLVEKGVRFVQLYHTGWDSHGGGTNSSIKDGLAAQCKNTDRAAAALIKDLKQRGLLDETIVIWGGEFGRTPMSETPLDSAYPGRDHHPSAFTMWMAGGGIKAGAQIGETDELGYRVAKDPVSVHDLHATLLHLMGVDHTRLTYQYQGRDFRLTDVFGEVVKPLVA
ncbi:MAG: DUF1501 domain-containing protein [Chlorobia bacterium]|nr:DUF1501 domain-containing protein [Fimbriimonadaceae bacterium]